MEKQGSEQSTWKNPVLLISCEKRQTRVEPSYPNKLSDRITKDQVFRENHITVYKVSKQLRQLAHATVIQLGLVRGRSTNTVARAICTKTGTNHCENSKRRTQNSIYSQKLEHSKTRIFKNDQFASRRTVFLQNWRKQTPAPQKSPHSNFAKPLKHSKQLKCRATSAARFWTEPASSDQRAY